MPDATTPVLLALDVGTQSVRGALCDVAGTLRLPVLARDLALTNPRAGWYEQDPTAIRDHTRNLIEQLTETLPRSCPVQVGIAVQRSTIVAWDRTSGQPLSPAISWKDTRAADLLQPLQAHAVSIQARSGLPLSPHYGAAKCRWLLQHLPKVAAAAREGRLCIGPLSAYLTAQLTAERTIQVDPGNAQRMQLLDLQTRAWDPHLLTLFGLDDALLPAVAMPTGQRLVTGGGNIRLTAVSGDQIACYHALEAIAPASVIINCGTGAFLMAPLHGDRAGDPRLLRDCTATSSSAFLVEGTVNGAGSAVAWLAARHQRQIQPADIDQALGAVPTALHFMNTIGGLGSPYWRSDRVALFVDRAGRPVEPPFGEQLSAVLYSILFLIRANLDLIRHCSPGLTQAIISGGMSRSAPFCQQLADLCGIPVLRCDNAEATLLGAAVLAGQRALPAGASTQFEPRPSTLLHQTYHHFLERLEQWLASD